MNPERDAARLKDFIRRVAPGGCRLLSKGNDCECLLCAVDRLHARVADLANRLQNQKIATVVLIQYAHKTREHWDQDDDNKVGKRLMAMAGELVGYSAEIDAIHKNNPQPPTPP